MLSQTARYNHFSGKLYFRGVSILGRQNHWDKQQDTGWAKTNKEDTCGRELARGSV
jgi:hypothetical protein